MLLGAFVAWSLLPRVQYGKDNKNEKLEYLGRGPPPRPPPAADTEQGQQGGQQQQEGLAPQDVLRGGMQQQQQQGLQPRLVGGHPQGQKQNGERPEPSDEESPLPPPPSEDNRTPPVLAPQLRPGRKPTQAHDRQQSPEELEMERYHQPESSQSRLKSKADSQPHL